MQSVGPSIQIFGELTHFHENQGLSELCSVEKYPNSVCLITSISNTNMAQAQT